jgi:hypothetical protein
MPRPHCLVLVLLAAVVPGSLGFGQIQVSLWNGTNCEDSTIATENNAVGCHSTQIPEKEIDTYLGSVDGTKIAWWDIQHWQGTGGESLTMTVYKLGDKSGSSQCKSSNELAVSTTRCDFNECCKAPGDNSVYYKADASRLGGLSELGLLPVLMLVLLATFL